MSFLKRIGFIESGEQERERLAQAPEGSINHHLSTLPVNIREWPQDLLVQLPWDPPRTERGHTIVVVPFKFRRESLPAGVDNEPLPRKLHSGSLSCIVVSSDHPSYPVGGYRIVVSAAEIARGTKASVNAPSTPF
ncbi:hypothetical protein [Streptomyces sp. NPDC055036]